MFRHDARHTGNVNTPVDNIVGPGRDTVAIQWRIPIYGSLYLSSPAVAYDGTIYFGTDRFGNGDSGAVYAINPNGTVKWQ